MKSKITKLKNEINSLRDENHLLREKLNELDLFKNAIEKKNAELEEAREEQKKQNISIIRKSIDLSDAKKEIEDKNYDLKQLQITLEDLVIGRTAELKNTNKKLIEEINEKTIAQQALKSSEKLYRVIFENSGTSILIVDNDMTISMANAKAEKLSGYTKEEMINKMKWTDFVAFPEDLEKMKGYHLRRRQGDTNVPNEYEFRVKNKNGQVRDVLINIDLIPETKQTLTSMIDVTERNEAENAKIKLEKRLLQSQKMEAIGTLAGGIAHDFNNILSAVMGYTELSIGICEDNEKLSRWLDNAMKACMRAKELVVQILTFSRQNEQESRPVKLTLIIKEVMQFLKASFPSNILFHYEEDCQKSLVMGDPTQLHQVIMNLCTNAYQAMEATGGNLSIRLSDQDITDDEYQKNGLTRDNYIKLTISDTGCGIDNDIASRIFDPFFTTKSKGKGTGMGLSTAHGIMESLGGAISLSSEVHKGTHFFLYFPIIDTEELLDDNPDLNLPHGSETILLVDDDMSVLEMTRETLQTLGYKVFAVKDSTLAESMFKNTPDKFDLVITDHMMPGLTGSKLAGSILDINPDIPIIMYTGYSGVFTAEHADSIGITRFMIKPVTRQDLAEAIRDCLKTKPSSTK